MAVDQRKRISVMRDAVTSVEERYAGYRADLFDHVAQILLLEREHERKAIQIQKKISESVTALGRLIDKKALEFA